MKALIMYSTVCLCNHLSVSFCDENSVIIEWLTPKWKQGGVMLRKIVL